MRSALVIGADGMIGSALAAHLRAAGWLVAETSRRGRPGAIALDLARQPCLMPVNNEPFDAAFFCAGVTRFVDCEADALAYRVNVDAPLALARASRAALFVFLSSDAVEKALHTNYGMHKALAEIGMLSLPRTAVVRLGRVSRHDLERICARLASIAESGQPGLYLDCAVADLERITA